jgi:hypothetical protein
VFALRRLPVLHRTGQDFEHAVSNTGFAAGNGAAWLPARDHGPVEA